MEEVPVNEEFNVTKVKVCSTSYGKRIALDLNNQFSIFLPARKQNLAADDSFIADIRDKVDRKLVRFTYKGPIVINGKKTKYADVFFNVVEGK